MRVEGWLVLLVEAPSAATVHRVDARGAAVWAEVPGCAAPGTASAGVGCSKATLYLWLGLWQHGCVAVQPAVGFVPASPSDTANEELLIAAP